MNTQHLTPALIGSGLTAALFAAYLYWHPAGQGADSPVAVATPTQTSPGQAMGMAANTAPSTQASTPDFLPPGMGLVGTNTTGAQPSASFMIEGHLHTLGLGATLPGTSLVVKNIQDGGVQLTLDGRNDLYNIKIAAPDQIAQFNAEARANLVNTASSVNSTPRAANPDLIVLKDANISDPIPKELQITVRRHKMPKAGPVEMP